MQAAIREATGQNLRDCNSVAKGTVDDRRKGRMDCYTLRNVSPLERYMYFNLPPNEALLETITIAVDQGGYGGRASPT